MVNETGGIIDEISVYKFGDTPFPENIKVNSMTKVKILYWHDIPIQVKTEDSVGRAGVQLSARFQAAIDEAAMAANLIGDDDYTNGFQWRKLEDREGPAQSVAETIASEIEAKHTSIDWRTTVQKIKSQRKP
jgi:hypothetical protein